MSFWDFADKHPGMTAFLVVMACPYAVSFAEAIAKAVRR